MRFKLVGSMDGGRGLRGLHGLTRNNKGHYPRFSAWLIAMFFITLSIWVAYSMGIRIANRRSAFRWALGIALGGLLAYNYLVFGMFGVMNWLIASGLSGVIIFVFMGELLGFAAGWAWSRK